MDQLSLFSYWYPTNGKIASEKIFRSVGASYTPGYKLPQLTVYHFLHFSIDNRNLEIF